MPNWIEGQLRIIGKNLDIMNFLSSLEVTPFWADPNGKIITLQEVGRQTEEYPSIKSIYSGNSEGSILFPGGDRAYADNTGGSDFYFSYNKEQEEAIGATAIPFRQAWKVNVEYLAGISEKYNLELKLLAADSGQWLEQIIWIYNGNLLKSETTRYSTKEAFFRGCFIPLNGD